MRIYVSAGLQNATMANVVAQFIRSQGHNVTSEWTTHYDAIRKGLRAGKGKLEIVAADAIQLVKESQGLIAIMPGGLGTHTEIGAALGLRIPVALIGTIDPFVSFYMHPMVVFRSPKGNLESAIQRAIPRLLDAHFMVSSCG